MAIKPLKLKRYISEEEAAQLLSLLIDEKVSSKDMAEYALEGVIPAYMQFSPVDTETYPGPAFSLATRADLAENYRFRDEFKAAHPEYKKNIPEFIRNESLAVIPYPLSFDNWITDSNGETWKVFAGRADLGVDEVTSEHYVRVYAPPEVCLAADIMNDPKACPKWPAILHSHGETWGDSDGEDRPDYMLSPFRAEEVQDRIAIANGHSSLPGAEVLNWRMVIAGLVKLLEPQWPKQFQISDEIAAFKLPGAGKRSVDKALSAANQAMLGIGPKKRR